MIQITMLNRKFPKFFRVQNYTLFREAGLQKEARLNFKSSLFSLLRLNPNCDIFLTKIFPALYAPVSDLGHFEEGSLSSFY